METSEGQRKSSSGRGFDSEWCEPYAAHTTRQQPMFVVTARYALKRQGSQEAFCAQLELSRGVSQSHPLVFARRTEKKNYIYICTMKMVMEEKKNMRDVLTPGRE